MPYQLTGRHLCRPSLQPAISYSGMLDIIENDPKSEHASLLFSLGKTIVAPNIVEYLCANNKRTSHHEAEIALRSARSFLFESVQSLWDRKVSGQPEDMRQRALVRMASCHVVQVAKKSQTQCILQREVQPFTNAHRSEFEYATRKWSPSISRFHRA